MRAAAVSWIEPRIAWASGGRPEGEWPSCLVGGFRNCSRTRFFWETMTVAVLSERPRRPGRLVLNSV